jgi:hypothetical protein
MISKHLQKDVKYELIAVKSKGKVYSYLIEVFSNMNSIAFPNSIQNLRESLKTTNSPLNQYF